MFSQNIASAVWILTSDGIINLSEIVCAKPYGNKLEIMFKNGESEQFNMSLHDLFEEMKNAYPKAPGFTKPQL